MAPRKTPPTFAERIKAGEYREQLVELRDLLAEAVSKAEPREVAPLARQLSQVLGLLDQLKVPEVSRVDEIARKRQARRSAAAEVSDSTGG